MQRLKQITAGIDRAATKIVILKPKSKILKAMDGIQKVQNPNTAAKRTREVFISCARIATWLFAVPCSREGTMALLIV